MGQISKLNKVKSCVFLHQLKAINTWIKYSHWKLTYFKDYISVCFNMSFDLFLWNTTTYRLNFFVCFILPCTVSQHTRHFVSVWAWVWQEYDSGNTSLSKNSPKKAKGSFLAFKPQGMTPLCFSCYSLLWLGVGGSVTLSAFFKKSLQLLLGGGLLLLHQVSMAFGDTPAIRCGHGWTEWTPRGRPQLLPVITTGSAKKKKKKKLLTLTYCSYSAPLGCIPCVKGHMQSTNVIVWEHVLMTIHCNKNMNTFI